MRRQVEMLFSRVCASEKIPVSTIATVKYCVVFRSHLNVVIGVGFLTSPATRSGLMVVRPIMADQGSIKPATRFGGGPKPPGPRGTIEGCMHSVLCFTGTVEKFWRKNAASSPMVDFSRQNMPRLRGPKNPL